MFEEKTFKKKFTPQQAIKKAQLYCAYQERCHQEMRSKLYEWGLFSDDVENIISQLILDNFLNEERFAKAFAGGKFRVKKWGKVKIKIELKKRNLSEYSIRSAFKEIDANEYQKTLKEILSKKLKQIKDKNKISKNYKAAQYATSRGFEHDLIWDILTNQ